MSRALVNGGISQSLLVSLPLTILGHNQKVPSRKEKRDPHQTPEFIGAFILLLPQYRTVKT